MYIVYFSKRIHHIIIKLFSFKKEIIDPKPVFGIFQFTTDCPITDKKKSTELSRNIISHSPSPFLADYYLCDDVWMKWLGS